MKLPQDLGAATCEDLVVRWQITASLAVRLLRMAAFWRQRTGTALRIISGFRTAEEQAGLDRDGRPTAPDHLSTHRTCPATGADLSPEIAVTKAVKVLFGEAAHYAGLRWGGGSRLDSDGLPTDWNHVDEGPRIAA